MGVWEEEAGCSPSGLRLLRCPRTRAPVSAQLLDKQQAFLSLSIKSAWAVTHSCPLKRAWRTLLTPPYS